LPSERFTEKLLRWPRPVGLLAMAICAPITLLVPSIDAGKTEVACWTFVALFAARGAEKAVEMFNMRRGRVPTATTTVTTGPATTTTTVPPEGE
jgi:hypothetical protein